MFGRDDQRQRIKAIIQCERALAAYPELLQKLDKLDQSLPVKASNAELEYRRRYMDLTSPIKYGPPCREWVASFWTRQVEDEWDQRIATLNHGPPVTMDLQEAWRSLVHC